MMDGKTKKQIAEIIETHNRMVASFESSGLEIIADAAEAIVKAMKKGGTVFICGNGGSAADSQHIAAELVNRFECNRGALAAVALTTDSSVMTSIANDSSYEAVFSRQVEALVKKGDVLWAISTSGVSASVLAAAKAAKQKGALVLAFTGRKNSPLERLADISLCADGKISARSQEIHQLAYHIICKLVESRMAGKEI
jgi:D-sedoheptulose 7-phosphate isomerase